MKKDQEATRVDSPSDSPHGDPTLGRTELTSAPVSDDQVSHTPGPWHVSDGRVVAKAFDGSYKNVCDKVRGGSPDHANGNALLIAHAPEMFEALRRIVAEAQSVDHANRDGDRGPSYLLGKIDAIASMALWWLPRAEGAAIATAEQGR